MILKICIIGVKLNAQKVSLLHKFMRRELRHSSTTSSMTLSFEMMPDIDQALLQFIDVMNLLDPLLHFSHILVVNLVQIYAVGWQKV